MIIPFLALYLVDDPPKIAGRYTKNDIEIEKKDDVSLSLESQENSEER